MAKKMTVGQTLWGSLIRASLYDGQAATLPAEPKMNPESITRRWLEGMSRDLKDKFPQRLRNARERVGVTQERLAEIADLSVTGVAMIERGERLPNLDTAARICWALDVAAGVTLEQLA